jgi:hypothetical protein
MAKPESVLSDFQIYDISLDFPGIFSSQNEEELKAIKRKDEYQFRVTLTWSDQSQTPYESDAQNAWDAVQNAIARRIRHEADAFFQDDQQMGFDIEPGTSAEQSSRKKDELLAKNPVVHVSVEHYKV